MGIWNTVQKWQGKSVPPCSMIVAAAGSSCRMGGQDKLFAPLAGVPVLTRTLRAIDRAELVSEIVVAAQEERMEAVADLCAAAALHKKVKVVKGGASRTESVLAAALECDPRAELIAIHDGARPLVRPEMIDEMIRAGWQTQAAAPSTPVTDTVKVADDDRWVASTPDRSTLYAVQTPQVFQALFDVAYLFALRRDALRDALRNPLDTISERLGRLPGGIETAGELVAHQKFYFNGFRHACYLFS